MSKATTTRDVCVQEAWLNKQAVCQEPGCGWTYAPGLGRPNYDPKRVAIEGKQHVAATGHEVRADRVTMVLYYLPEGTVRGMQP